MEELDGIVVSSDEPDIVLTYYHASQEEITGGIAGLNFNLMLDEGKKQPREQGQ